jgi:cytochrome c-type biogenesis protein CcmH/NrfG
MTPPPALVPEAPRDAGGWHALALKLRAGQQMVEATQAFAQAAALAPDNPDIAIGHAQTCYACGLPAVALFLHARRLVPAHLPTLRLTAIAMAAEGEAQAGDELLEQTLRAHPDWLEGHKALSTLRWTMGRQADFIDSYEAACRAQPRNHALRMAWFHTVAAQHDWAAARRILDAGERVAGDEQHYVLGRLYLACETVDHQQAERLLAPTAALSDAGVNLCQLRYYLRTRQLDQAAAVGERLALPVADLAAAGRCAY